MKGRLNVFQQLAVAWNRSSPYNAVHVVRCVGAVDENRLRAAISESVHFYGIGLYRLYGTKNFSYETTKASPEITFSDAADTFDTRLQQEMESGLNYKFNTDTAFAPLRFFCIRAKDSFCLGIIYHHVIADADSIIRLAKFILARYNRQSAEISSGINLYPSNDRPRNFSFNFWKPFYFFVSDIRDMMRTTRVMPQLDVPDHNGLLMKSLSVSETQDVLNRAKEWRIKLNDLFLAALWRASAPFFGHAAARKRNRLAVASIMNIRQDLYKTEKDFGLFLSSFKVSHSLATQPSLEEICKSIHAQTQRAKNEKIYLRNLKEMRIGLFFWGLYDSRGQKRFFAKYYPLAGGITNIHLKNAWTGDVEPENYWRAVSTSPATPLVISVTMVGHRLNLSLSYSNPVYSAEQARAILNSFISDLKGGRVGSA